MKRNLTPIASGVALFVAGVAMSAQVQAQETQTVTVTGIRASLQQSLSVKRRAATNVEVVTAEDVGKMPDKNVADSLQRLPGVNISQSAAGSGGFDENDRVSLRGTSPSLAQTLINGHAVSSGDWFILDQVGGAVGRSVSFSMLPSELVGQVVVKKTPTADMIEGGVSGTVDILTRHPLDAKTQFSVDGSIQAVYATLPKKTDPQASFSINWRNESKTFGVLLQGFHEKRHLRRDGQELLGWSQIKADSAAVLGAAAVTAANAADAGPDWNKPYAVPTINTAAHPDLAGVWVPRLIGSALFEQERTRKGGLIDIQFKPTKDLAFELSYFDSKLEAGNYNRNYMMDLQGNAGGILGQSWNTIQGRNGNAPDAGYTIQNGILTSAKWTFPDGGHRIGIVDDISRPNSGSSTKFLDFDASFKVSDNFKLSGKIGVSKGNGDTPTQDVYEGDLNVCGAADLTTATPAGACSTVGGSVDYRLNGLGSASDVHFNGLQTGSTANFTGTPLDWIFGASPAYTRDKDRYAQLDGLFSLNGGFLTDIKFGYRGTKHERWNFIVSQRPYRGPGPNNPATGEPYWNTTATPTGNASINPAWDGRTYPSDFASGLGGDFPRNVWQLDPAELAKFTSQYAWRDATWRTNYDLMFNLEEKTHAAYVNFDFASEDQSWSGNFGVRYVQTKDRVQNYNILSSQVVLAEVGGTQDELLTNALAAGYKLNGGNATNFFFPGSFAKAQYHDNNSNAFLPTFNLKLDVAKDLVARLSVSRTMTRPDFGALAGTTALDDQARTGNAGNWDLKPVVSNNFDATLQWYYAPRALLSIGAFYMDLRDYVGYKSVTQSRYNAQISDRLGVATFTNYDITMPFNVDAAVKGLELAAQVPLGAGFGADGNITVADANQKFGTCPAWTTTTSSSPCDMLGASKVTYNVGAFFENDSFNARLGWSWRSAYLGAYDRGAPFYQDDVGTLSVSANYNINKNLTLTFSGQNLNNPVLKNYVFNPDMPRSFYQNGAQYYAGLRFKF